MAYKYDIFISYRREKETRKWIEDHFKPILMSHLHHELGYYPEIFIDDQELEIGSTWPIDLGNALGASKTLVPLWTRTFLNSIWCTNEIGHMIEREVAYGYRTKTRPNGLIFPTIIHDGETLPVQLSTIQNIGIQECFNVRMAKDSPKGERLAELLIPLAEAISFGINNAPQFEEKWKIKAINDFFSNNYKGPIQGQMNSPKHV